MFVTWHVRVRTVCAMLLWTTQVLIHNRYNCPLTWLTATAPSACTIVNRFLNEYMPNSLPFSLSFCHSFIHKYESHHPLRLCMSCPLVLWPSVFIYAQVHFYLDLQSHWINNFPYEMKRMSERGASSTLFTRTHAPMHCVFPMMVYSIDLFCSPVGNNALTHNINWVGQIFQVQPIGTQKPADQNTWPVTKNLPSSHH